MLVGHFAAGKTSVKRSLLCEKFVEEHETTDGIETEDTWVVNVDTAVNWQKSKYRLGRLPYTRMGVFAVCIEMNKTTNLGTVHKFQWRGGGWQNMGGSPVFNECIWGGHLLFRQLIGGGSHEFFRQSESENQQI